MAYIDNFKCAKRVTSIHVSFNVNDNAVRKHDGYPRSVKKSSQGIGRTRSLVIPKEMAVKTRLQIGNSPRRKRVSVMRIVIQNLKKPRRKSEEENSWF